ncbi:AraC family transcriptional regulator [Streptococcus pasteurianus]|uniref:AraC family transcriptional regulator n=1 Tax=Streptococcus pasteurianus TaxID=197614 RepID=UPI0020BE08F0|nr:AraC family transcriptional regulator [Streptococcus pasteurianus]WCQ69476.1 AraC family transcriptional regulator [Streptococcus pasteurianus]WCQ69481.1 AraC family transcriptional regulator [Streptococcus pasteurianus]
MREVWKHFYLNSDDITLSECGIQQFEPEQNYNYTVTENFVLHYVETGKGELIINNRSYFSTQFNGFILKRGEHVSYRGDKDTPWKNYWLGIKGNDFKSFLRNLTIHDLSIFNFSDDSHVVSIIKEICLKTKEEEIVSEFWYKQKTYELLSSMQKEFEINELISLDSQTKPIIEIYEYICKNFQNHLSINDLASNFGISRSSLYRQFKSIYCCTPKKFILELKIDKACQLLKETDFSIKEIADLVGFDDYSVFSKSFKKIVGESPSFFRQNLVSKEIHENYFEN